MRKQSVRRQQKQQESTIAERGNKEDKARSVAVEILLYLSFAFCMHRIRLSNKFEIPHAIFTVARRLVGLRSHPAAINWKNVNKNAS